ncbi:hypothetical protein [Bacillus phage SDFMU_Pbc]|uniref:Uncharacterized protein n=1 Tax=Bacillus phage SDFMU_Pbc TaxID=3076135 RepID=A0AA96R1B2_9CAUD|nr:hypothetical protein [Bacillus phage SDFMU_Pbc]
METKIIVPLTDKLVKHIRSSDYTEDSYLLRITEGEPIPGISKTVENYTFELASSVEGTRKNPTVFVRYSHPGDSKVFEDVVPLNRLQLVLYPSIAAIERIKVLSFLSYSQLRDVIEMSPLQEIVQTLAKVVLLELPEIEAECGRLRSENAKLQESLDDIKELVDRV